MRACACASQRSRPQQALAADQHQHDEEQAEPEVPVLRRPGRDQVVQQLEDDGAEDAAVEIAGAADHEHQQHLGAAVEVEHVERGEAAGLRQQRAGRAGDAAGERCRPRPAARAPRGRCWRRAGGCRAAPAARRRTASARAGARTSRQSDQHDQRCRRRRCGPRGRTRSSAERHAAPSTTPCRPSAPPVSRRACWRARRGWRRRRASPSAASGRCRAGSARWRPGRAAAAAATATDHADERVGHHMLSEQRRRRRRRSRRRRHGRARRCRRSRGSRSSETANSATIAISLSSSDWPGSSEPRQPACAA